MRHNNAMAVLSKGKSSLVSIRRLTGDDAKAVAELSGQLGYPVPPDDLRQRIQETSHSTDSIALAALLDDQIVGWIEASIEHHLQSPACAIIGGLVVRDTMRGLGIGKRLCHEIEQWTRSKSIALLRVRSQIIREDAHRFYLREGYRQLKTSLVFEKSLL
jgi:GNAT superfamily N-acetyltransferase